jgi:hypothetical protein
MKNIFLISLIAIAIFTVACSDETLEVPACGVPATVRDLTGLDGCGFVFEASGECGFGSYLIPLRMRFCGTPPLSEEITEDPLYNFEFVEGKRVSISYELMEDYGSACMAGQVVKITCIQELDGGGIDTTE